MIGIVGMRRRRDLGRLGPALPLWRTKMYSPCNGCKRFWWGSREENCKVRCRDYHRHWLMQNEKRMAELARKKDQKDEKAELRE